MKQPKKLTWKQKRMLVPMNMNPDQYQVVEETKEYLEVIEKETGKITYLTKGEGR